MVQAAEKPAPIRKTVLLDRNRARSRIFAVRHARVIDSPAKLHRELQEPARDVLWICYDKNLTREFFRAAHPSARWEAALFLHELAPKSIAAMTSFFRHFAFSADGGFLPPEELADVLQSENRSDLFIGGSVDESTRTVTLWRGNLESLTVPFSAFPESGDGIRPEFSRFAVTDSGQTIQFGRYEAAAEAVLYEYDPAYRRRIKRQRQASEQSFGASLRRLRKQRGLRREDFAPEIASRTVARIEQGQVKRIRPKTLKALAARLGVSPDEISSY